MTFYSTAAQVLPIIFLVLAFEFHGPGFRFLPADLSTENPKAEAAYTLFLAIVIVAGEATALFVLVGHEPSRATEWLVGGALIVGGLGVMVPVVMIQLLAIFPRVKRVSGRMAANFFAYASLVLLAASGIAGATLAFAAGCQAPTLPENVAAQLSARSALATGEPDVELTVALLVAGTPATCVKGPSSLGSNSLSLCSFDPPFHGVEMWCVSPTIELPIEPAIPGSSCLDALAPLLPGDG